MENFWNIQTKYFALKKALLISLVNALNTSMILSREAHKKVRHIQILTKVILSYKKTDR